jgi:hypothetical protein
VAAALTLVVVTVALVVPGSAQLGSRLTALTPLLLFTLIVAQPTGLELTGSWLGWPPHPSWTPIWEADPAREAALAANVRRRDPGGAGEYLQRQLANDGPFRYVGYSGFSYPGDEARRRSYMTRRFDPHVTAILVNGRPLFLGLYDIQGYNPIQMSRYREFITALNGKESNYHIAYLLPSGAGSPLLKLLDVRYVVIDASLPDDREDVLSLRAGRHLVFRNDLVAVYEDTTPSHAWIVHDVRPVTRGEALPLLTSGTIDLSRTALIEGATPLVEPATGAESARVTHYSPEAITIATSATAPGLLVVSEVYAAGWRAIVDGEPTSILPTNHVLRGIPIPAGQHVVELRYELPALQVGLLISTAAWVALLLALVNQGMRWGKQRGRKSRDA